MNKNSSVHLQDFPDISFLSSEEALMEEMDMVRQICSTALFIRDQKNLRVRLPLNKLTIIGKNAAKMLQYKDIIADEVNVKNIEIIEEIGNLAELKLQINFKKIGAKFGSKIKEITAAAKENKWKKLADNKIEIAGEILADDEFEIKLITKNQDTTSPLSSNDCLVELDIKVTKELEEEGLARDVVRAIQQNRKDANLDISNHIEIAFYSSNKALLEVINNYQDYLKEQVLADKISISTNSEQLKNHQHYFQNKIEDNDLEIGFSLI
ncbi:MAG: ileS [Rickettsiaceae bacterium]|jgi:isoleucyl-tRNA synthetase|nr:ileS [Rickettsiaceae bacterium]